MSEQKIDEALGLVMKPLRSAMLEHGIDEDSIVKELKVLLTGESKQAKAKAIEIISKWANWNSENIVISEEVIKIADAPDDLDI